MICCSCFLAHVAEGQTQQCWTVTRVAPAVPMAPLSLDSSLANEGLSYIDRTVSVTANSKLRLLRLVAYSFWGKSDQQLQTRRAWIGCRPVPWETAVQVQWVVGTWC